MVAAFIETTTYQQPVALTPDYMLLPVESSFSWHDCFQAVERGEWYLVVFRSKHAANADEVLLTELDNAAAAAAAETPGFIHYFIGTPRPTGECLSFCLWESKGSARAGSSHAAHRRAIEQGMHCFEYYALERYSITKAARQISFLRL